MIQRRLTIRSFCVACLLALAGGGALFAGEPNPAPAPEAAIASDMVRARRQHYLYAHRVLPRIFFRHTDTLLLDLQTNPDKTLTDIWESLGKDLPEAERISPVGLTAGAWDKSPADARIVVVTLPSAERSPEAAWVALVVMGQTRRYLAFERMISLEKTHEVNGILCAWTDDGRHENYGLTAPLTRDGFESLLETYLKNSGDLAPQAGFAPDPAGQSSGTIFLPNAAPAGGRPANTPPRP